MKIMPDVRFLVAHFNCSKYDLCLERIVLSFFFKSSTQPRRNGISFLLTENKRKEKENNSYKMQKQFTIFAFGPFSTHSFKGLSTASLWCPKLVLKKYFIISLFRLLIQPVITRSLINLSPKKIIAM